MAAVSVKKIKTRSRAVAERPRDAVHH